MAELAVDFRARGVVGFDLAGEEGGYPPKKHVDAFHYIQRENFNITIHAGEGYGKESIWQAIQYCGAHRIGHGTRLIDDIAVEDVQQALERARALAKAETVVVITGSIYLVGEVMRSIGIEV